MIPINIKSISINQTYKIGKQGKNCRMYLSKDAKKFKEDLLDFLEYNNIIEFFTHIDFNKKDLKLCLYKKIGVSNIGSDVDNSNKLFQDVLANYLGFNDNRIFKQTSEKRKVEKGKEYIDFELYEYVPSEYERNI